MQRRQKECADWHSSWHETLAAKEISEAGGILWPPTLAQVVAIEAKCAYSSDRLHSTKDSKSHVKDIRKKVDRLEKMGVDRIAHLDVIANPPSDGINSTRWLEAAGRARDSLREMKDILKGRLPDATATGQFVWSVGSVAGGDESIRGAGVPLMLRPWQTNPYLAAGDATVLANRKVLLSRISEMLGALAQPTSFPAIFAGCPTCKKIRWFYDAECSCPQRSRLN